ncbi:signal recognition particle 14 kd protein [Anaeramoeba ignava]|uniref:Signal recognition particle 14 kDa protein n=1 Tax=Anaeramoeba ignava TaxID=1746090 RepID=A0A9Q0L7P9_ANAIG|nr:signal recognition particle 14 kd protein [Anaeramoeba ignava]
MLLKYQEFLRQLAILFQKNQKKGSVFITFKRTNGVAPHKKKNENKKNETHEYFCLIRATDGEKKISTHIHQRDIVSFQISYAGLIKENMSSLKKKIKNKNKKPRKKRSKKKIQTQLAKNSNELNTNEQK